MMNLQSNKELILTSENLSSSTNNDSESFERITVSYVTDIEGNYDYWERYISISKVLYLDSLDKSINADPNYQYKLRLKDNCYLVFGGDICDRGPGDLRLLRDLVHLKRDYPDRVFFIAGNRDVNKLRLLSELHDYSLCQPPKVYWFRVDSKTKPDGSPLNRSGAQIGDSCNCSTKAERLKWILNATMGAPQAFELRRKELSLLQQSHSRNLNTETISVSDDEIAQSFLDSIDPKYLIDRDSLKDPIHDEYKGILIEFLRYAQIILQIGDILFVHGAIHTYNIGWLPTPPLTNSLEIQPFSTRLSLPDFVDMNVLSSGVYLPETGSWIKALNRFFSSEIEDYIANIHKYLESSNQDSYWAATGGYDHPQPGSRLLQYGMGWLADRSLNPSVIYATYSGQGRINPPSADVSNHLKRLGIRRILVGHQPNGDSPLIINPYSENAIQVIGCDSSYSQNVLWHISQHSNLSVSPSQYDELKDNLNTDEWISFKAVLDQDQVEHIETNEFIPSILYPNPRPSRLPPIDSTRGIAVADVSIYFDKNPFSNQQEFAMSGDIIIDGRLSNGLYYRFSCNDSVMQSYLGRQTADGWTVKGFGIVSNDAPMRDYHQSNSSRLVLLVKGEGYTSKNMMIRFDELERIFNTS